MINITKRAVTEICDKFLIDEKGLQFLGGGREDSDGTLYIYESSKGKMVLKILAIPEKDANKLHNLETRVNYANYLGVNGIKIAYPLKNYNGNIYETCFDNEHYYAAYIMNFCEGRTPENDELTDELVHNWGKMIGKSHRLTKAFSKNYEGNQLSYNEEVSFFKDWCKDANVKTAWSDMENYLKSLPKGENDYGFIHNDNHQRNILVEDRNITMIDFDCAGMQFFIQDITTPAQGLMFDNTGGMMSPLHDPDRLKRFFDSFLSGYEKENHLDDIWYRELTTFINYRRLLLFTCMQDWVNTNVELKNSFLSMINNPPQIIL